MITARVDGVIVATISHPSLHGCRTVICQPVDELGRDEGTPVLAVDPHGARRDVVKPAEKIGYCTFARAGVHDDADHLAGRHGEP